MDDDPAAFCARIRGRLVGSLALWCGDRAVAEELAQEALVRTWERWSTVREMEAPEAWTFRVALNLGSSWRRRRAAERRALHRHGRQLDRVEGPDVADVEAIRVAVAELPERQRATIVARYYLGLDVAATAEALECAPGTVTAATRDAIANLRRAGLVPNEEEVELR
jgi:RNA polymerase sigma factor (sigma-70 family)